MVSLTHSVYNSQLVLGRQRQDNRIKNRIKMCKLNTLSDYSTVFYVRPVMDNYRRVSYLGSESESWIREYVSQRINQKGKRSRKTRGWSSGSASLLSFAGISNNSSLWGHLPEADAVPWKLRDVTVKRINLCPGNWASFTATLTSSSGATKDAARTKCDDGEMICWRWYFQ